MVRQHASRTPLSGPHNLPAQAPAPIQSTTSTGSPRPRRCSREPRHARRHNETIAPKAHDDGDHGPWSARISRPSTSTNRNGSCARQTPAPPSPLPVVLDSAICANWIGASGLTCLSLHHRPHPGDEVYVTGTFDNWSKSEQMEKVGDKFEKSVELPDTSERIYYKVGTHKSRLVSSCSFPDARNLAHIFHQFTGWRRRGTRFYDTPRRAQRVVLCVCEHACLTV